MMGCGEQEQSERGENPRPRWGGRGVSTLSPTLPCSYLWKGEVSLSGAIMMLLSTVG